MLKTVFIGSKNDFDKMIVDWLSDNSELTGVVWTYSAAWRKTWKGRFEYGRKRAKKYGLMKVINELLLFFYVKNKIAVEELGHLKKEVIRPYWENNGKDFDSLKFREISCNNVNKPEVLEFLNECKPDIIFAMCVNDFFGKKIRDIPTYGVYLWHEGLTPEYKGLYSPFWTLYNEEYGKLAYTFMKMNDNVDGGEIYAQGPVKDIDLTKHSYSFIGHKAIYDSLPDVKVFLEKLQNGTVAPMPERKGKAGNYTYPGLTQYFTMRRRLKKYLSKNKKN